MSAPPNRTRAVGVGDVLRIAIVNQGESAMRLIRAVHDFNEERGTALRAVALYAESDRAALFVREADEAVPLESPRTDGLRCSSPGAYVDADVVLAALQRANVDAAWVGVGARTDRRKLEQLCKRAGIDLISRQVSTLTPSAADPTTRRLSPLLAPTAGSRNGSADKRPAGGDRCLEIQVVADRAGTVWTLGPRDCSIRRRGLLIVEESSPVRMDDDVAARLCEWARDVCKKAGFVGVGNVEFVVGRDGLIGLIGIGKRDSVEDPVTEMVTGLDLVKMELHLAFGGSLAPDPPERWGYAIGAIIRALDPANHFLPSPGRLLLLRTPSGPGIRVDCGLCEGDNVASGDDTVVAKVTAWGGGRPEALGRLRRAIAETAVILDGGATDRPDVLALLRSDPVARGVADSAYADRRDGGHPAGLYALTALLLAAAEVDETEHVVERARFYTSAARGRPRVPEGLGREMQLRLDGHDYRLHVERSGPGSLRVRLDGRSLELGVDRVSRFERRISSLGSTVGALLVRHDTRLRIEIDGEVYSVSEAAGGLVRAPSPSVLVSLRASVGDKVEAGDIVAVVEAMKLETPVLAACDGTVSQLFVAQNVQLDAGAPILQIDPHDQARGTTGETRVSLPGPALSDDKTSGAGREVALRILRDLVRGYDRAEDEARAALDELDELRGSGQASICEYEVLDTFADICALARRLPEDGADGEAAGFRSPRERFFRYLRGVGQQTTDPSLGRSLERALYHYGISSCERSAEVDEALFWIARSHRRTADQIPVVLALLGRLLEPSHSNGSQHVHRRDDLLGLLDRLETATRFQHPAVAELSREVRLRRFEQPLLNEARQRAYNEVEATLAYLADNPGASDRADRVDALVACTRPLHNLLSVRFSTAPAPLRAIMLEVMTRRYYRAQGIGDVSISTCTGGYLTAVATLAPPSRCRRVVATFAPRQELPDVLAAIRPLLEASADDEEAVVEAYLAAEGPLPSVEALAAEARAGLNSAGLPANVRRVVTAVTGMADASGAASTQHLAYHRVGTRFDEEHIHRGLHPAMAERLQLWRLRNFRIERVPSPQDVYLFCGRARDNPSDERLFAIAEVRDLTPELDRDGNVIALPELERMLHEALASMRTFGSPGETGRRTTQNRVLLYVWPPFRLSTRDIFAIVRRVAPDTRGLDLEKVVVSARARDDDGRLCDMTLEFSNPTGGGLVMRRFDGPAPHPIQPLTPYGQKVASMRRRGLVHPYEIVDLLAPSSTDATTSLPAGIFLEHDLAEDGMLVPVDRPYGQNTANLVVGVIRNFTGRYPEGMTRVILLGDPSRSLGALAEPECRRIIAALDTAERLGVPLEWFTLSSGAKIAMDSGTENMDWIARVLRRIIEFTQAGGEVNLVVNGINVGAQPYWNAEATMLMHTHGILVMTPEGSMVLTGKQALDYSGGVSADDNFGIGGYEHVMGPNGQAQYWAPDLSKACEILHSHYDHSYRAPDERFPRRDVTSDPFDRDVCASLHPSVAGTGFSRIGEIFSDESNPGRKKPFDIRAVMAAVIDADHVPLERWSRMLHAGMAVVWDAHLGGNPVSLLGIESRPLERSGFVPADGPDHWTPGTLFPQASKKIARAINAASANRPLVVLGNLSGFDGSPESMRRLQLEFGAEIGRAIVNFRGPIVFCVISRYHGGAFVVFSAALNESIEVAAVEGSFASVIGGAPAAAVVFSREVDTRTRNDARVVALRGQLATADPTVRSEMQARLSALVEEVRGEKMGEVAAEYDSVHNIRRACGVGSVHRIIEARRLRPYLIDAVERGMVRELQRTGR